MDFNDVNYDKYATPRQLEMLETLRTTQQKQAAADKLGISRSTLRSALKLIKGKAVASGYIPENGMTEPFDASLKYMGGKAHVKDGKVIQYWPMLKPDEAALEQAMMDKLESLTSKVPSLPKIKSLVKAHNSELANLYTISDFHIGMLAWHQEGGDNWNLDIAEQVLKVAYADMIMRSPNAEMCIVNELGDYEHYTSMLSITPAHGHILDADSRPEKMISVSFDLMEWMIAESCKYHKKVVVSIVPGNHNDFISLARKKAMMMLFRNNPQVEFIDYKTPYSAMVFGKTLIGFHHGHKRKPQELPAAFSNEFRSLLGSTDRTVIHTGHQHHKEVKENGKTTVEMHRTLAARDAHASHGAFFGDRSADAITYHKEHGEFSRVTVGIIDQNLGR
jgi:hypothetical protein